MTTTYLHTCDGCGAKETSKSEASPFGTVNVTINLSYPDTRGGHSVYDLCAPCQDKLLRFADPSEWEKAKKLL